MGSPMHRTMAYILATEFMCMDSIMMPPVLMSFMLIRSVHLSFDRR